MKYISSNDEFNGLSILIGSVQVLRSPVDLKISKPPSRTLAKVVEKTEDRMGYSYHRYDAIKNNCQDFLMNILTANKFGSAAAKAFIKQDVKGLIR